MILMTNLKLRAKDPSGLVIFGDCNSDQKFHEDNFVELVAVFETDCKKIRIDTDITPDTPEEDSQFVDGLVNKKM